MSTTTLLLTMAACGAVTFLIRLSFIAFGHHLPDDPRLTTFLRYVPPAILGALIAPENFRRKRHARLRPEQSSPVGCTHRGGHRLANAQRPGHHWHRHAGAVGAAGCAVLIFALFSGSTASARN